MSEKVKRANNPSSAIIKRKKTEQALADEATRRRILIDQSRDGIVVLDENGKVFEVNQKFAEMLRCTPEEAAQLSVWDWEYLYPREQVLEMIRTVDEAGDHFETQHRRQDGSVYDVEISTNGAVCAGQKLIFCVCRDITERKNMERQLQEKNEQLDTQNEELRTTEEELRASNEELQATNDKLIETQEQLIRSERLAAIGQLASGVGHELRNPLGAIKNAGFYIRRRLANTDLPNTEPKVMEFLDLIDEEVNSANKVITDLLGFSRVAKPTVAPVSIAGVIEDALRDTPLPENVELIKEINNNLPMVMVDADQIRQVILNIAINAIQAMPEGGRLDIRASSKGKFVEVEFADTGGGIPEDIKNKIFDPLFTTKAKGVGLGLSVCKSILERHEGDIRVKSQEGKGTTFTLSLPAKKIPEGSAIQGKGGKDDENQRLSS
jgi:PAS domain S-box-containing protein